MDRANQFLQFLAIAIFSLVLFSCEENKQKSNCRYGEPVPIFSDTLPGVLTHEFEKKGQEATENVTLKNGVELEVMQSGCDAITQEFRFQLAEASEQQGNWFQLAASQFSYLSSLSTDLAPLGQWASVIEQNQDAFRLGEAFEVNEGFSVRIDKIDVGENILLIVTLSEAEAN